MIGGIGGIASGSPIMCGRRRKPSSGVGNAGEADFLGIRAVLALGVRSGSSSHNSSEFELRGSVSYCDIQQQLLSPTGGGNASYVYSFAQHRVLPELLKSHIRLSGLLQRTRKLKGSLVKCIRIP